MRKTAINFFITLFIITNFLVYLPNPSFAAGASLFLSPSAGSKYAGDKFNLLLYVNSSQSSNTYDVTLSVSNLTVTGISIGGSICILFPTPPSYNNISARFRCGLPTPGYTGSNGYIGAMVVKANAPGTAKVSIDSGSSVLANDGAGTNILGSRGSATFTVLPPPTSAPAISSATHPNQDKWYKSKSPTFSWTGSGNSFSYALDQNPDGSPDQVAEGAGTTKSYDLLADGVWYFHVIVKGSSGTWSGTSTYRVQIDSTPPEAFTPEADPKNNADKRPIVVFNTTDKTSGVDHYELKVGDGKWDIVANPYKLPKVTSGNHTIFVKAVDKAGNEKVGQVEISVKNIAAPIILSPENNSLLTYSSDLVISGKSFPSYKVRIYLDGKEIGKAQANKDGDFSFTYEELLRPGNHKLYAVAVNPDDIESPKSSIVNFHLDPQSYIIFGRTIPGNVIFSSLVAVLLLTIVVIFFLLFGASKFRKKLKSILEELEEKVEGDLDKDRSSKKVKAEIEEDFSEAEEKLDNGTKK